MKQLRLLIVLIFLFVTVTITAQSQKELYNASVKAYESKEYVTYLKLTKTLDSLRPFHPTYTYNLASAYALNENKEMALQTLKRLVMMNNTVAFEKDSDFNYLKEYGGLDAITQLKTNQNKVISNSNKVVSLSEKELHPEGLTYLSKAKTWLATSIRKRKIVSFDSKTGKCTDWLTSDGMLAVFAIKADADEKYLWVATAALPEMENYSKALEGKAEILKVAIKTKQIVKRFPMDGNHVFGDLTVTKKNVVYVSDSVSPILYKIENDQMATFFSLENDAYNLQGIVLNSNENKLFIADYLKGVLMISLEDGSKNWIHFPEGSIAKGIDGMVFNNNCLYAIQNGVKPIRVVQFQLNALQNDISGFKIIDNNRLEFNEPAQATIVDDKLYFFANSPWNAYDNNGNLDLLKFENPMLFNYNLKQ